MQRDGLFGLTIQETSTDGTLTTAAKRLEYLPIAYLVPFDGNEEALSYDLGSEPRYRRALDAAGDFGRLLATDPLPLPRVHQTGTAVWLILPLYARNSDTVGPAGAARALIGFAIGVLRIDAFVRDVLATADSAGMNCPSSMRPERQRPICMDPAERPTTDEVARRHTRSPRSLK